MTFKFILFLVKNKRSIIDTGYGLDGPGIEFQ